MPARAGRARIEAGDHLDHSQASRRWTKTAAGKAAAESIQDVAALNCTIERATHAGPPGAYLDTLVFILLGTHILLKRLTRARCTYFGSRSSILF